MVVAQHMEHAVHDQQGNLVIHRAGMTRGLTCSHRDSRELPVTGLAVHFRDQQTARFHSQDHHGEHNERQGRDLRLLQLFLQKDRAHQD